LELDKWASL
nr:Chain C, GP41 PEPTIDE [Human immunodeficiency virus 1]